jgi:hypothetical protein
LRLDRGSPLESQKLLDALFFCRRENNASLTSQSLADRP